MQVKDLTLKQFITLMANDDFHKWVEGKYDTIWFEKLDKSRINIDGAFSINRKVPDKFLDLIKVKEK